MSMNTKKLVNRIMDADEAMSRLGAAFATQYTRGEITEETLQFLNDQLFIVRCAITGEER